MVLKLKESFEKTRHVKNNDKSEKYILRGENVRYYEKVLSNKKETISFLKRTISFSFVRVRTFDRARTFTRTFDRGFVRGEYNDLKYCKVLLLLWRGKMIMNFLLYSCKKMKCV